MAVLGGNDPHSYGVTSRRASMNTLRPIMECVTGVEPACNGFAIRGLTVQLHTHITILKNIREHVYFFFAGCDPTLYTVITAKLPI